MKYFLAVCLFVALATLEIVVIQFFWNMTVLPVLTLGEMGSVYIVISLILAKSTPQRENSEDVLYYVIYQFFYHGFAWIIAFILMLWFSVIFGG